MAEGRTAFPLDDKHWYVEPRASTAFLLQRERFEGLIYDPSCGGGNIVLECIAHGLEAVGTDIVRRVPEGTPWFLGRADFLGLRAGLAGLSEGQLPAARNIVMNPPYGRAKMCEAFIRSALAMPGVEKVAAFVSSKFLFGEGRAKGLYTEHPPTRTWLIYPRPSCPPGTFLAEGGKAKNGVENFAWLVWDRGTEQSGSGISWAKPEAPA